MFYSCSGSLLLRTFLKLSPHNFPSRESIFDYLPFVSGVFPIDDSARSRDHTLHSEHPNSIRNARDPRGPQIEWMTPLNDDCLFRVQSRVPLMSVVIMLKRGRIIPRCYRDGLR